jgi:hypothetical protein
MKPLFEVLGIGSYLSVPVEVLQWCSCLGIGLSDNTVCQLDTSYKVWLISLGLSLRCLYYPLFYVGVAFSWI